jgi:hypothetical protein
VTDPTAISAMDSSHGSRRRFTAPRWQRSLALVARSGPGEIAAEGHSGPDRLDHPERPGAREEPVDA